MKLQIHITIAVAAPFKGYLIPTFERKRVDSGAHISDSGVPFYYSLSLGTFYRVLLSKSSSVSMFYIQRS